MKSETCPPLDLQAFIREQRTFFRSGATLGYAFRCRALDALYEVLAASEADIAAALSEDLGKSEGESYLTETGIVLSELSHARKRLKSWMRPRRVSTPLFLFPAASRIHAEPLGLALIISPWNYPFLLSLAPLINAVSAGDCVILKPSSRAPATAALLERLLASAFEPAHVRLVRGGPETGNALLTGNFDFLFYTGSAGVGKKVMRAAAERLVPVCLELGGKSPAIVCEDADLPLAARRIAWGKTVNAGQTCVAPDYVLAHERVKDRLLSLLEAEFARFPGPDALQNKAYAGIVTSEALERLNTLAGGQAVFDVASRRMAPLLLPEPDPDSPLMREEIFGPLLPVLGFSAFEEALAFIRDRATPLSCYIFTRSRKTARALLQRLPFGGGCVNDVLVHAGSHALPFGGAGASGMGRYHGRAGFELFSNLKSVIYGSSLLDFPLRYPPYGKRALSLLKRLLK
jgi:aldehyde dehydrogenase (NAD+)